jgi:hypothetical protein
MDKSKECIPGVDCTVTSCYYNQSKKCAADHILVSSKSDEYSEYADCVTYKPKSFS